MATEQHPRITLDPKLSAGKLVIRGTRLSVEFVIGLMPDGDIRPITLALCMKTSLPAFPMRATH